MSNMGPTRISREYGLLLNVTRKLILGLS